MPVQPSEPDVRVLEAQLVGLEALMRERDLRYTQLRAADQRALEIKAEGDKEAKRIKEEGDSKALNLERENRAYKDEKANNLRTQIESERGNYATKADLAAASEKIEATLAPVLVYVASQQGNQSGRLSQQQLLFALLTAGSIVFGIFMALRN